LPSEAEWEYAARAGSDTKWHFGDDDAQLGLYAWYDKDSAYKTHAAGGKQANPFGLYDMHGNVREWVEDCWHDNYHGAPGDGSAWSKNCPNESVRVLRGGSWYYYASVVRAAIRFRNAPPIRNAPTIRYENISFRVARTPR
jgi:formylglycine-generating enzyme required for sulfatase activity